MRFTPVVISTTLSASMALADGIYPYAGYRLEDLPARRFHSVSARFQVPHITVKEKDVAYIGTALGDPTVCGTAIEVGVVIRSQFLSDEVEYRGYWQEFPVHPSFLLVREMEFKQGDRVRVSVDASIPHDGPLFVSWENETTGKKIEFMNVGHVSSVWKCLGTASWALRAEYELAGARWKLKPIPQFESFMMYNLHATDAFEGPYTAREAKELTMVDSGDTFAHAQKVEPDIILIHQGVPE